MLLPSGGNDGGQRYVVYSIHAPFRPPPWLWHILTMEWNGNDKISGGGTVAMATQQPQ